jgi:hypothetical protein
MVKEHPDMPSFLISNVPVPQNPISCRFQKTATPLPVLIEIDAKTSRFHPARAGKPRPCVSKQMAMNHLIGDRLEISIFTLGTLHMWFVAERTVPFVCASGGVAGISFSPFPSDWISIFTPTEEGAKKSNPGFYWRVSGNLICGSIRCGWF